MHSGHAVRWPALANPTFAVPMGRVCRSAIGSTLNALIEAPHAYPPLEAMMQPMIVRMLADDRIEFADGAHGHTYTRAHTLPAR